MIILKLREDLLRLPPPRSSHLQKYWVSSLNSWPIMFRLLTLRTTLWSHPVASRTMYNQLTKSKNWETLSVVNSSRESNLEMQYSQEAPVIIIVETKSHLTDLPHETKAILSKCKALQHRWENLHQVQNRSFYKMVIYLWICKKLSV